MVGVGEHDHAGGLVEELLHLPDDLLTLGRVERHLLLFVEAVELGTGPAGLVPVADLSCGERLQVGARVDVAVPIPEVHVEVGCEATIGRVPELTVDVAFADHREDDLDADLLPPLGEQLAFHLARLALAAAPQPQAERLACLVLDVPVAVDVAIAGRGEHLLGVLNVEGEPVGAGGLPVVVGVEPGVRVHDGRAHLGEPMPGHIDDLLVVDRRGESTAEGGVAQHGVAQ